MPPRLDHYLTIAAALAFGVAATRSQWWYAALTAVAGSWYAYRHIFNPLDEHGWPQRRDTDTGTHL